MKIRTLISALCLAAAAAASAQSTDTVATFYRPDSVVVRATTDALSVTVDGDRAGDRYHYTYSTKVDSADNSLWNINLPFTKSQGNTRRSRLWVDWGRDLYVGAALPVANERGMRAGWEIGLQEIVGLYWRPSRRGPCIGLGAGIGYRSANVGNGYMLDQENRILFVSPTPEDVVKASSRLHLLRLHVPLTVTQRLFGHVSLRVGAVLNLNTYMSATTKFKTADVAGKTSFHSLRQRFATVDVFGAISFCNDMGLYVRYSPMETFAAGCGPRYKALSFGITGF